MGFFDRLGQVIKGKASNAISGIENRNPEAVYEAAIDERVRKYDEMKKAVAGLVHLRDQRREELGRAERDLARLEPAAATAVEGGEDENAITILEEHSALSSRTSELRAEIAGLEARVEEGKAALRTYQDEIGRLKAEKTEMLARNAGAEARIDVQASLDGLSTDATSRGLASVREHIRAISDPELEPRAAAPPADLAKARAKLELAALKKRVRGEVPDEPAAAPPAEGEPEPPVVEEDGPKRTL